MHHKQHTGVKTSKRQTDHDFESIVMDFGNRTISDQNFSKIVALPKTALTNCGSPAKVNVKLVQQEGEKYLKLTPLPLPQKRSGSR